LTPGDGATVVRPRTLAIVGFHLVVALLFVGVAAYNLHRGDTVNAVMQSVIGVLILMLGIGLARAA
jgi:hypothetical protein